MNKTATKMLILGVAVLALLGTAMSIKNSYAKTELDTEKLQTLNAQVEDWFGAARTALEESGVEHSGQETDLYDRNTVALGESVSVPSRGGNPLPWMVIILAVAGGASLLFVAINKQYQPVTREASVKQMVDKIVAKNESRLNQNRRMKKMGHKEKDEFDKISRAVDEIVAKYNRQDH